MRKIKIFISVLILLFIFKVDASSYAVFDNSELAGYSEDELRFHRLVNYEENAREVLASLEAVAVPTISDGAKLRRYKTYLVTLKREIIELCKLNLQRLSRFFEQINLKIESLSSKVDKTILEVRALEKYCADLSGIKLEIDKYTLRLQQWEAIEKESWVDAVISSGEDMISVAEYDRREEESGDVLSSSYLGLDTKVSEEMTGVGVSVRLRNWEEEDVWAEIEGRISEIGSRE